VREVVALLDRHNAGLEQEALLLSVMESELQEACERPVATR
jgi:hypothetical protein